MCKKKSILVVAPYVTFPNEPGANRFITIVRLLSDSYDVVFLTSRFCHILKKHRTEEPKIDNIKIILLDEPGYVSNVGFSRLFSHRVFCKNFELFLEENGSDFDLVYSAFPLIYTNFLLGKHKEEFGYKLVIDVQDIWPDSITGPIPALSGRLGKIVLSPINKYANRTYAKADGLVAVSDTYLKKADVSNLPRDFKTVVYIGSDDINDNYNYKPELDLSKPLTATYIGTMAGSYDLATIIEAAALCKGKVNIKFIGAGPHEHSLKLLNKSLENPVIFLGLLPYEKAMKVLANSDVAINPIKTGAQQSITNKLSDYLSCGLPIVSCQKNREVMEMLALGGNIQYESGNAKSLSEKLLMLSKNRESLLDISNKNFGLAQKKFSRENSYLNITKLIDRVLS
jgi:glycosyltransferase involved in cell wall biosynthesis